MPQLGGSKRTRTAVLSFVNVPTPRIPMWPAVYTVALFLTAEDLTDERVIYAASALA